MRRQASLGILSERIVKEWCASTSVLPVEIFKIVSLCLLQGIRVGACLQGEGDGSLYPLLPSPWKVSFWCQRLGQVVIRAPRRQKLVLLNSRWIIRPISASSTSVQPFKRTKLTFKHILCTNKSGRYTKSLRKRETLPENLFRVHIFLNDQNPGYYGVWRNSLAGSDPNIPSLALSKFLWVA